MVKPEGFSDLRDRAVTDGNSCLRYRFWLRITNFHVTGVGSTLI